MKIPIYANIVTLCKMFADVISLECKMSVIWVYDILHNCFVCFVFFCCLLTAAILFANKESCLKQPPIQTFHILYVRCIPRPGLATGRDNNDSKKTWLRSRRRWNLTTRDRIAHNLTEWPWSLRKITLTLTYDHDVRTRPRFFSNLRNFQAESRYLQ